MKNKLALFALLLSLTAFSSCRNEMVFPPYAIKSQAVRVGEYSSYYNFAGAHITLCNKSDKVIREVSLKFLVFDSDGQLCSPLGNSVVSVNEVKIKPLQEKEIIISLDEVLGPHLDAGYQIANLFAAEIVFSDGTVWSDPFGLYAR